MNHHGLICMTQFHFTHVLHGLIAMYTNIKQMLIL